MGVYTCPFCKNSVDIDTEQYTCVWISVDPDAEQDTHVWDFPKIYFAHLKCAEEVQNEGVATEITKEEEKKDGCTE